MSTLVLYINELSFQCGGIPLSDLSDYLNKLIEAANKVSTLRDGVFVRMHCKLSELTLGDNHYTLGAILPGVNGRLSQLKRLVDKTPYEPLLNCMQEVQYNGQKAIGISWADLNKSFGLSLGHTQPWSETSISCERHSMNESCEIETKPVEVRNIANVAHVNFWTQAINDFGKQYAGSSILYKGNGFVMRMHFDDHPPCHVHIYPHLDSTEYLIAKLRVDNGDIMKGSLSADMYYEVIQVITEHRLELIESWENIRVGKKPLHIQ